MKNRVDKKLKCILSEFRVLINYLNLKQEKYLMNINYKNLINEYRNYLIMLKVNTTKVNMSIKSIDDIKIYE